MNKAYTKKATQNTLPLNSTSFGGEELSLVNNDGRTPPHNAYANVAVCEVSPTSTFISVITSGGAEETIWTTNFDPLSGESFDGEEGSEELGTKFQTRTAGQISAIRFYKPETNTTLPYTVKLYDAAGTLLMTGTDPAVGQAKGWYTVALNAAIAVVANTVYLATYNHGLAPYWAQNQYFVFANADDFQRFDSNVIGELSNIESSSNGVFGNGSSAPTNSFVNTSYFADPVFVSNFVYPQIAADFQLDDTVDCTCVERIKLTAQVALIKRETGPLFGFVQFYLWNNVNFSWDLKKETTITPNIPPAEEESSTTVILDLCLSGCEYIDLNNKVNVIIKTTDPFFELALNCLSLCTYCCCTEEGPQGEPGPAGPQGPVRPGSECTEINARQMWKNEQINGTTVGPYTFIPRGALTMTPIIGWGVNTGPAGANVTNDPNQVITLVENPCAEVKTVDICTTVHYVLINDGSPVLSNFAINWEQQLQLVNNGDTFGPNIPGVVHNVQYMGMSEPTSTTQYRHYVVQFKCASVNILDSPMLWLGWRRRPTTNVIDYAGTAYIVAAAVCCQDSMVMDCVGSIGFWKNQGVSLQCYPVYLGTYLGTYTIPVNSSGQANVILSKTTYTSGPNSSNGGLNNLLAQLLAAKFASDCNLAYVPPIVQSAISIADTYLAALNGAVTPYVVQSVEDPNNLGVYYDAAKVLELYNNPGVGSINSISGPAIVFVRATQVPAWPLEDCTV